VRIGVHLRDSDNRTNIRSIALRDALEALGHTTITSHRDTPIKGTELVIQTGFAQTHALLDAIDRRVPYIIMEAPYFRGFYEFYEASSWGYNGLAGGSWRPTPPPSEERAKPMLLPLKTEGGILIVGQKPNDHSLRGSDHGQWLLDRFREFPTADFRPHPLTVAPGTLEPIDEALRKYKTVITYTSTMGVDALQSGSIVRADHRGSLCWNVRDRDVFFHDLSWAQASHGDFHRVGAYVLSGYDDARSRAEAGLVEHPRPKVDGPTICQRYYRALEGV